MHESTQPAGGGGKGAIYRSVTAGGDCGHCGGVILAFSEQVEVGLGGWAGGIYVRYSTNGGGADVRKGGVDITLMVMGWDVK